MNPRYACLVFGITAALAASCGAADSVKTAKMTYIGTIKGTSPTEVQFERNGAITPIPVNEIINIRLDGEPSELNAARAHAAAGRYADARESLGKVKPEELTRDVTKAEFAFLNAFVETKTALGGSGDVAKAGSAMVDFVRNHPESLHVLEANELIGDLLVAGGKYDAAQTYYQKLTEAPWPAYQVRAQVLLGKAQLAEGKTAEAAATFQAALAADVKDAGAVKVAAELGLARCLAVEQKYDEAVETARRVIAAVDPEDASLSAQAYNTLGSALNAAGKKREALMAFLHVDVLYFNAPNEHAEALVNLAQLWTDLNRPERAAQTQQILKQRYNR